MTTKFDKVLDECIDRITLAGETVESCLASYPQHAATLEPHLRLVAQSVRSLPSAATPQGKARAQMRLNAVLDDLVQRDVERASVARSHASWLSSLRVRWAPVAASVLIVMLVGGVGAVGASSRALPGDALYPVKRVAEQVRLSLASSPVAEAELRLAFAERRADEMSALIRQGAPSAALEKTGRDLQTTVSQAASAIATIDDERSLSDLRDALEARSESSLARIQAALVQASEETKQAATLSFQASGQAYGAAMETVAERTPDRYAMAGPGRVQMWAVDPPPPGIDAALVTLEEIAALRVDGGQSEWVLITSGPITFDLVRVVEVKALLGAADVKPGAYTRVRFRIAGASVEAAGIYRQAAVPVDDVVLTRPFKVEEGATTAVYLDFDGSASLVMDQSGAFRLTPLVRVLAWAPGEQPVASVAWNPLPTPAPSPWDGGASMPQSTARATPLPSAPEGVPVIVTGRVTSLTEGRVMVNGQDVALASEAGIPSALGVGTLVEIVGVEQRDGTIVATDIRVVLGAAGSPVPASTPLPGATPAPGDLALTPTSTPMVPLPPPGDVVKDVVIEGRVSSISGLLWLVEGRPVRLSSSTDVQGFPIVPGARVRVEGTERADGSIDARRIVLTAVNGGASPTPTPPPAVPTPTPTPLIVPPSLSPTASPASTPTHIPSPSPIPTVTPSPIPMATGTPMLTATPAHVDLTGTVLAVLSSSRITVDDATIHLTDATVIEGSLIGGGLAVGMNVRIEGVLQPDGSIVATAVTVL